VTGTDKPGVTAALTRIISESRCSLLDIKQVVVEDQLILAFLIEFGASDSSQDVLKDLLFKAKEFGLDLDFHVSEEDSKEDENSRPAYVISVLAREVHASGLSLVAQVAAEHDFNIERINRLSEKNPFCVEFRVGFSKTVLKEDFPKKFHEFKTKLLAKASVEDGVDVAIQPDDLFRRAKRLVVLDMDSTLIQGEVIDELAHLKGVEKEVSEVTKKAMRGEMQFEESLRKRVALLKGLEVSCFEKVMDGIRLTDGATELIRVLKKLGLKIAVISGGFTPITLALKERLGLDYAYANDLEVMNGVLTGGILGSIITPQRKADLMDVIAQQEGIALEQVIAIGDGANDLLMLDRAGMGIAFNAKPIVKEKVEHSIDSLGLDSILYLMGINERDVHQVLGSSSR